MGNTWGEAVEGMAHDGAMALRIAVLGQGAWGRTLASVLRQAGVRFRLQEWNDAAQRKLAALDNVYDKLHDDAATLRAEVLEILIVLLIVFEIVLSLAGD